MESFWRAGLGIRRSSPNRHARPKWSVVLPTLALVILVAFSPAVDAGGTAQLGPPYKHSAFSSSPQLILNGPCKTKAVISSAAWSPTTGNVTLSAGTSARTCASPPLGAYSAYAQVLEYASIAFPVRVTTGGHNFSVSLSYNLTVNSVAKGAWLCPHPNPVPGQAASYACARQAAVITDWWFGLLDATNRTPLRGPYDSFQGPTNDVMVTNTTSCTSAGLCTTSITTQNCSSFLFLAPYCVPWGKVSSGTNVAWINTSKNCAYIYGSGCYAWRNWTLNASHHYWVIVTIEAYIFVYLSHYPKGDVIAASIDAASPGSGGWRIGHVSVR